MGTQWEAALKSQWRPTSAWRGRAPARSGCPKSPSGCCPARGAPSLSARKFPPPHRASRAVGHIKRAVQSGLEMSFSDGLALERELQQRLFESEDAREGIAAN